MSERWLIDRRPVRSVSEDPRRGLRRDHWPATPAPVRQLLEEGLDLGGLTILVGGTGKATMVEGIAIAYGLSPEGGSTGARILDARAARLVHLLEDNPGRAAQ